MTSKETIDALKLAGRQPISIDDFEQISARAAAVVNRVRKAMLQPYGKKAAPTFQTAALAALVGLDMKQVDYRVKKGGLPPGTIPPTSKRRVFTVGDVRKWCQALRSSKLKPEGGEAITLVVANFKGGVTKTTTAVAMAQGLALRGHRCLLIDADAQASATSLFGLVPEVGATDSEASAAEKDAQSASRGEGAGVASPVNGESTASVAGPEVGVDEDQTLLPLCKGDQESVEYAIRETYWEGLDLIPASASLFAAEFELPARQMTSRGERFEFWNVLNNGIEQARLDYDVIIIDTPPALSYLTVNALMAADGMIMPLPPSALDFLSSTQFWGLVSSLTEGLKKHGATKEFDFIDVVLAKVDPDDAAAPEVRRWIAGAYGDKVVSVSIPKTSTAGSASAEFGTVYDQHRKAATQAYDNLVDLVEEQIGAAWLRQLTRFAEVQ